MRTALIKYYIIKYILDVKSLVKNALVSKCNKHQLFLYDVCFDCWENKESKQWYYCIGAKGSQVKIFIALFISLPCDDGS